MKKIKIKIPSYASTGIGIGAVLIVVAIVIWILLHNSTSNSDQKMEGWYVALYIAIGIAILSLLFYIFSQKKGWKLNTPKLKDDFSWKSFRRTASVLLIVFMAIMLGYVAYYLIDSHAKKGIKDLKYNETNTFIPDVPMRFERKGQNTFLTPLATDTICKFYYQMEEHPEQKWVVLVHGYGEHVFASVVEGRASSLQGPCLITTKKNIDVLFE